MTECHPEDFFDTKTETSSDLYKIAYLLALSKDQFAQAKNSGSLGAKLPIEGVPLGLDLSYDQTQSLTEHIRSLEQLDYGEEHHKAIYSSILSDNGRVAYIACITAQGRAPATTVLLGADAQTDLKFFVRVHWCGGVENTQGKFNFVGASPFQVLGGKVSDGYVKTLPNHLESNHEIDVPVERDDMKTPFKFATSINRLVDDIVLPPNNPRPIHFTERYAEVVASSSFGWNGNEGAEIVREGSLTPNANEEFLPETVHFLLTKAGSECKGQLIINDSKRIRWEAYARASTKEAGAYTKAAVSVIVAGW